MNHGQHANQDPEYPSYEPNSDTQDDADQDSFGNAPGHPRALSQRTIDTYNRFVMTLRRSYLNTLAPDDMHRQASPDQLAEYLMANARRYRPRTFSAYRAGLLYWISTLPPTAETLQATLLLSTGIPRTGFKGVAPQGGSGENEHSTLYSRRSMRKRTFSRARFQRLAEELERRAQSVGPNRISRAATVLTWLRAGLASGLRPIEWDTAQWEDASHTALLVKTAKRKVGVNALPFIAAHTRELPEYRRVPIDAEDHSAVDQHLANIAAYKRTGGTFQDFYDNNRNVLWNACVDVFGKDAPKFTLYLMRGQFAANRKRRMKAEEVAEQMGCALNYTYTSYGKLANGHRRHGKSGGDRPAQTESQTTKQPISPPASTPSRPPAVAVAPPKAIKIR